MGGRRCRGLPLAKGSSILLTGDQPPLLFEAAPLLMALAVLGLGRQLPGSRARSVCLGLATAAAAASLPVLAGALFSLPEAITGAGMALAQLAVVGGLAVAGVRLRRRASDTLPLALAVATLPAVLLGGLLSTVLGERALELPLVGLGAAWVALGIAQVQGRYSPLAAAHGSAGTADHR